MKLFVFCLDDTCGDWYLQWRMTRGGQCPTWSHLTRSLRTRLMPPSPRHRHASPCSCKSSRSTCHALSMSQVRRASPCGCPMRAPLCRTLAWYLKRVCRLARPAWESRRLMLVSLQVLASFWFFRWIFFDYIEFKKCPLSISVSNQFDSLARYWFNSNSSFYPN